VDRYLRERIRERRVISEKQEKKAIDAVIA